MFFGKYAATKIMLLMALSLIATACSGAAGTSPAPPPDPLTAPPNGETAESVSLPTAVPEDDALSGDVPSRDAPSGDVPAGSLRGEAEPDPTRLPPAKYADLEMVTLLPRDAIPAIDNPRFLPVLDADDYYDPDELVIGVVFNGEARAYSVPFLSNHEIVNDTVGGAQIAVTW